MNKSILKKLPALLAILVVAGGVQTFTSCSSDGGGNGGVFSSGDGNVQSVSSSSVDEAGSSSSAASSSSSVVSSGSSVGCPISAASEGSVTCGGQTYRTVKIGEQVWFAENLNYNASGSKCYGQDGEVYVYDEESETYTYEPLSDTEMQTICAKFGRLYDWVTAMGFSSSKCYANNSCSGLIMEKHQGICPNGWHIPSEADWNELIEAVGGSETAGIHLKATTGWLNCGSSDSGGSYVCEDTYGFSALPGGYGLVPGLGRNYFGLVGEFGYWWSTNGLLRNNARRIRMTFLYNDGDMSPMHMMNSLSVRCVKD